MFSPSHRPHRPLSCLPIPLVSVHPSCCAHSACIRTLVLDLSSWPPTCIHTPTHLPTSQPVLRAFWLHHPALVLKAQECWALEVVRLCGHQGPEISPSLPSTSLMAAMPLSPLTSRAPSQDSLSVMLGLFQPSPLPLVAGVAECWPW